jgi:hypothetical protein
MRVTLVSNMTRKRKIQIGDTIEIPTSKGLAYAQYSHNHPRYGALLRILPGTFATRPDELERLVCQPEVFVTFFPLQAALNKGIFEVVSNFSVPESAKNLPLFRTGVIDPKTGRVKVWWLWDGQREWRVGDISREQRKLPFREIWNDTLLIERIESGWTPYTDPT